ncbi:MAG: T9SS type A sorting domain-containing protein [Bacteroidetes bacterium]|nr:T9SS type A sorting domain-containing protein [Bacteroidota bacterium]
MKKLYITLLSSLFIGQLALAQTLTKASNEPVIGNTNSYKGYDSSGVIPKNTGANMSWNFSAITQNTTVSSSTFVSPSSVPSSSAYPSATIVEDQGSNSYVFYKSVATPTTSFESLGFQAPNFALTFTNSAIAAVWPISFGYSNTDTYSGSVTQPVTGTLAGTIVTNGSGTGTITLPGGAVLSNILQVKTINTTTLTSGSGFTTITGTISSTDYSYYHSSDKFELVTVSYQKQTLSSIGGPTITSSASIKVNSNVIQGLTDNNLNATFQIFPNPAKDAFNVNLTNANNAVCTVEIYNSIGTLCRVIALGNSPEIKQTISLTNLSSGIYIVKTTLGAQSSSRRLIVE